MSEAGERLNSGADGGEGAGGGGPIQGQAKLAYGDAIGAGCRLELPVDRLLDGAVPESLIYKSVGGNGLRLLVVKPEQWRMEDRRSAILWIHGGGWSGGQPEQFVPHCRYAALRGAVGFSVQYRLIPSAEGAGSPGSGQERSVASIQAAEGSVPSPGELEASAAEAQPALTASGVADCLIDCMDALRFIREQAAALGVDPDRIVVAGDSAGGHLAACIGTLPPGDPLRPFAVVNCNGIVDVTDKWRHAARAPLPHKELPDAEEAVREWFRQRDEVRRLSPLQRIRAGQPPSLTLHGLLDRTVEAEQSARYVEAHLMSGNDARLILYPRSKHAFVLFGYTATVEESMEALGDMDRFLAEIGLWRNGWTL